MPALNMFKLDSDYLIENFLSDFNGNIIGYSYFSMVRPTEKAFALSLSHSFKLGILKENKKNLYSIGLIYNLAPKVLGLGTYKLDTPDFQGGGILVTLRQTTSRNFGLSSFVAVVLLFC